MSKHPKLTQEDFEKVENRKELLNLILKKDINIEKVVSTFQYEQEKKLLQIELVKLQKWANNTKQRIAIIFEGRDAAGKGGNIRRFTEHLNPRSMRLVALSKRTNV